MDEVEKACNASHELDGRTVGNSDSLEQLTKQQAQSFIVFFQETLCLTALAWNQGFCYPDRA